METRKRSHLIEDIEDTLCSVSSDFVGNIYRMVVGKEPQVRNNVEIIMEVLSEVDEEFLAEVYKKVMGKNCDYDENNKIFVID
jgi:hypothetical protein